MMLRQVFLSLTHIVVNMMKNLVVNMSGFKVKDNRVLVKLLFTSGARQPHRIAMDVEVLLLV